MNPYKFLLLIFVFSSLACKKSSTNPTETGTENSNPKSELSDIQAAAGINYIVILKKDKTLWLSGLGVGVSSTTFKKVGEDIKYVTAAAYDMRVIKSDDSLWGNSYNGNGQLGLGHTNGPTTFLTKMADNVLDVACGDDFTLVLKKDNTLWSCGFNSDGQLGDGSQLQRNSLVKVGEGFKRVWALRSISFALKSDNSLWMAGYFPFEPGHGFKKHMDNVKSVGGYNMSIFILKTDNTLWGTSSNRYGQLGTGNYEQAFDYLKIADNVKSVSATSQFTAIIKNDNSLWMTGDNRFGQFGDMTNTSVNSFKKIADNIKAVCAGDVNTVIIKSDDSIWTTGHNQSGQLGSGEKGQGRNTFQQVMLQ